MAEPMQSSAGTNSGSSEVKCWLTWGWSGWKMNLHTNNSMLCESFRAVSSNMFFCLSCSADTFNTQWFLSHKISSTTPGLYFWLALTRVQSKSCFKYSLMNLSFWCSALYLSKVLRPREEIQYRMKNSSYLQLIALRSIWSGKLDLLVTCPCVLLM